MKKFLIFILVIIIIIGSIFTYNYLKNKKDDLNELENTKLNPVSSTKKEKYFLLYIDEISNDNSNLIVNGIVSKGNVKINEEISIVGLNKKEVTATIKKIENNGKDVNSANQGDNINLTLESNIGKEYISKGQAVIISGTTKPIYNITAKLNSISGDNILEIENKVNTFNINYDIGCSVKITSKENNEIKITLDVPIIIDDGIEISLKDDNKVIAKGIAINN